MVVEDRRYRFRADLPGVVSRRVEESDAKSGPLVWRTYTSSSPARRGADGYTADTGHIVAFTDGLDYKVRPFGGMKGLFFSGEGLVCDFHGGGTLFLQTRNPASLAGFLHPFRPIQARTSD